ncbi:transmembrane and immunoglobulin domain-containing protein 2 isoform X1 [Haemorhous mexicanus]|uniref:transmembrane and immunoglobulin domain-containing protein 2 isoform X1 n=1 Tax=Haemorhous mexicanus TaxID=30427 RepID=UPI0028BE5CEF|nr:transmembrane and immunoglobulin domain-containing protein 2 isoform X1 [Haemorhous mexicanus]XP_059726279.1 transmembrane and immunoglobulin domain-containing protein 2 isoform X1 [Haemorhous mexicanus]
MWQLGVLIPLLGAGALRVTQEPGELQVTAGDTVALECRVALEVAEGAALLRMEWLRDRGLGVLCATRLNFSIPLSLSPCPRRAPGAQLAWHPPRATLSLPQVQRNDSGRYLCRVTLEIPRHDTATGNGTELRVTPAALGGHRTALLWALLGGLGSLGGTALLLGMALLVPRCCHRSPGAVHPDSAIYLNVGSTWARGPAKPPPPAPEISPYQREPRRARGPSPPPRP